MLKTDKDCKEIQDQVTFDKIDFYQGYPVYYLTNEDCSYLLPCGICGKTNAVCPLYVHNSYKITRATLTGGKKND